MGQADPILTRLNAGPSVKKLVETALALSNSPDPQQRNHAYSFWETAIKELEDDEDNREREADLGPHEDDGIDAPKITEEHKKDHDDEHQLHEEELSNNNTGSRTTGSEQSTDNTQPYPGQGEDTTNGEKPMQDMDGTVNQWSETNGMPPGMGGMPQQNPMQQQQMPPNGGGGMIVPGLAPDIAQEMGQGMPAPPPMDTNQMMRQMQYTINAEMKNYHNKVIAPMTRLVKQQREAIKSLSKEIRETRVTSGSLKLDLDSLRENATAKFRETVSPLSNQLSDGMMVNGAQPPTTRKKDKLDVARFEISQMDKIIRQENSTMYG